MLCLKWSCLKNIVFTFFFRLFIPLPKLTDEGCRISLCRLRNPEIDNFEFSHYVMVNFMSIDIRLSKLDTFKKEIFIFDLNKFTMSHLTAVLPQLKKFIYCATVSILLGNVVIISCRTERSSVEHRRARQYNE